MKLLITGGTGLIGARLCAALSARGHELWVLSRSPWKAMRKLPSSVTIVGSLEQVETDLVFDGIINLAGEGVASGRWSKKRKQKLFDSRVGVTKALHQLVDRLTHKPKVLISGSAVGFYGDAGNAELTENSSAVKKGFTYLLCDAWEQEARRFSLLGVRVCILRIGVVISRHGGMLSQLLPLYKKGLGPLIGDGSQWFSWIHIEDLIALIQQCLDGDSVEGVYNAVSPQPVGYHRFHTALGAACHRPVLLRVPPLLLNLALGEMSVLMLGGQKVLPMRLEREGFKFKYPDIDSALKAEVK